MEGERRGGSSKVWMRGREKERVRVGGGGGGKG